MRSPAFHAGSLVPFFASSGIVALVEAKEAAMCSTVSTVRHRRHIPAFLRPVTPCPAKHKMARP
jgi:hypothetical protein